MELSVMYYLSYLILWKLKVKLMVRNILSHVILQINVSGSAVYQLILWNKIVHCILDNTGYICKTNMIYAVKKKFFYIGLCQDRLTYQSFQTPLIYF